MACQLNNGTHQVHNLKELISSIQLSPKDKPLLLVGPRKQEQIEWLTALITHVFNTERNSRVLITMLDNFTADTLSLGLLRFVPPESLTRIVTNKAVMRRGRHHSIEEIIALQEISKHRNQLDSMVMGRIVLCTTSMAMNDHIVEKRSQFTHTLIADCVETIDTLEFIRKIRKPNSTNSFFGQLWLTSDHWPPSNEQNKALGDLPLFVTHCSFRKEHTDLHEIFDLESNTNKTNNFKRRAQYDVSDEYNSKRRIHDRNTIPLMNPEINYNMASWSQQPFITPKDMETTFVDFHLFNNYTQSADARLYNPTETDSDTCVSDSAEQYQPSEPIISPEEFAELKSVLMASSKNHDNANQRVPNFHNLHSDYQTTELPMQKTFEQYYSDIDFQFGNTPQNYYKRNEHQEQFHSDHYQPTDIDLHQNMPCFYDETSHHQLPCGTKNVPFICGPLPEFAPSPVIDKLTKLKYEFSDEMSSEEVYTLQSILNFQGFAGPDDYVPMMQIIIGVEDCFVQNDRTRHDRPNRQAVVSDADSMNPYLCSITSDSVPAFVMAGDKVLLSVESSNADAPETVLGEVKAVCESTLELELSVPMQPDAKYTMHFALNRLNFRLEQFAMLNIYNLELTPFLFPETHPMWSQNTRILKFYNQQLANECHQRKAVEDIVAGQFYPCPYILSGCAGSGKTDIIVESIIQLYNASPNNRVLVCSPSNGVLDEITVRLASWSGDVRSDCLRLFASSTENNVDKASTLYKVSNFSQGGKNSYIFVADLIRRSRILLSTLAVSGRIALTNLEKTFFSHIIIDECHASGEPMTLVPIASICSSKGRINAKVILVGDPQQMGPVVKSPWAKRLNYGRSLMARLLQLPIYKQDQRLSSKLCANYRSHSRIVEVASSLFYRQGMIPNASIHKTTTMFPDIQFPIKFDNVDGKPSKGTSCDSWYNMAEVHHVISLVIHLVQVNRVRLDDIGIISPYRRQIMKITNQLGAWRHRIKVGSVEQFQGVERHIIIVSTVRTKNLGFVTDPGRINVILTRAMSILVVVGNASSLEKQSCEWAKVIEICRKNGTLCDA